MISLRESMYRTPMDALRWYAQASQDELLALGGAVARICIGKNGTPEDKAWLSELRSEPANAPVTRPRSVPEPAPIAVFTTAAIKDHNAGLGARAEGIEE